MAAPWRISTSGKSRQAWGYLNGDGCLSSAPIHIATTADTDDRVVPGHTFKYVAALQAADIGPMPRLARIDTRAGHGAGKPIDKTIAEAADLWAFAAHWTGLDVGATE